MASRTVSVKLVADIGQYVAGMGQAAAATKTLGTTATQTQATASRGFSTAGKGALLLGGAVVAGLGMAVSKSMEFEKAMSGVAAATMATGGELSALRDAAMEAGAATQFSATDAANAITELGKAGVSTADILAGGLMGAMNLAAAGQMDVAAAAEIAATAMTQFKLSGEDLPHVADLLAAGAGKAQGSVADLGMALNQAGLVASATGLSIEETTGTLAAFASAGLVGSDAGTSLKTMLQRLQNPSEEAAATMAELGISMYDANGQFVGMESLAGQLQGALGGLTQAERDKAMATIFGSDAVRAANVLYSQGAQGIAEWTAKVNDAGFAQRQAAALTDNLAGDLERLGGAFDTLLITLGEGAQGPLRMIVQALEAMVEGVTAVVEVWQSLPGPVQTAIAAFAAMTALRGPLTSLFQTVALRAMYFGDSIRTATTNVGGFRGAMSGLVGAVNPLTIALAAASAGVAAYVQQSSEVDARLEAAADAGESFRSTLASQGGQMNLTAREAAKLAVEAAGLEDVFSNMGVSARTVQDALTGNADAYREALAAAEEYDAQQTYSIGNIGNFGYILDGLTGKATENADAFREMAGSVGEVTVSSTGGFGRMVEASRPVPEAIAAIAAETQSFSDAASEASGAVDELKAGLDELSGETVSLFEAEAALAESIAAAKGAIEDKSGAVLTASGGLNAYSEAGRAAGEALIRIRDDGNQAIATMKQQGDTADEVAAAEGRLRVSFIQAAMGMGISREAARDLADQILGIPEEREARVNVRTDEANAAIEFTSGLLDDLGNRTAEPSADLETGPLEGGYDHSLDLLSTLSGQRPTPVGSMNISPLSGAVGIAMGLSQNLAAQRPTPVGSMTISPLQGAVGVAMGLSRNLAAQRPTPIGSMNISPLSGAVGTALSMSRNLAAQRPTPTASLIDRISGTVNSIIGRLRSIPNISRTVTITTINRTLTQSGIVPPQRARGGPVWPGQEFLVGEEGPELVRFSGRGTVIPAPQTQAILSGREQSAASSRPVVNVSNSLSNATVTGRLEMGEGGIVRLIDGRIDAAMGSVADTINYAGG